MKLSIKTFLSLLAAGTFAITACNNSTESSTSTDSGSTVKESSTTTADTSGTANTTATNANPDQETVNYLVPKNETEIAWLLAGMANGGKEVKDHAKMMLADHKAMGEKVKGLITKKGWATPTVDTTGAVNLTAAKGKEWDKAWTDKMVSEHSEIIDRLKSAETAVKDEDFRTIIKSAEPVVQKHLDMAKAMQGKM